jgi:hypothetical protein
VARTNLEDDFRRIKAARSNRMDDENGDNQGFGWVLAGCAAIIVILMLLGAAWLLGWLRISFVG